MEVLCHWANNPFLSVFTYNSLLKLSYTNQIKYNHPQSPSIFLIQTKSSSNTKMCLFCLYNNNFLVLLTFYQFLYSSFLSFFSPTPCPSKPLSLLKFIKWKTQTICSIFMIYLSTSFIHSIFWKLTAQSVVHLGLYTSLIFLENYSWYCVP